MLLRGTRARSGTTNIRSGRSSPASAGPRRRAARRGVPTQARRSRHVIAPAASETCARAREGCRWRRTRSSFDYPVGAGQEGWWDRQAERLRGLEVDDELQLGGLLDGQVTG